MREGYYILQALSPFLNMTSQAAKAVAAAKKRKWSRIQPLWQIVVLNMLTLYSYSWFWFWKNWEDLHQWAKTLTEDEINQIADTEEKRKILRYLGKMNVFIHGVGVAVEYLQMFFATLLFWQIGKLSKPDSFPARQALLWALVMMAIMGVALKLWATTDFKQLMFAVVLGTIPQMVAQVYLNDFWRKMEPADLPLRARFTSNEFVLIALGAGSMGLMLSGLLEPMPLPPNALNNVAPEIFGAHK
jgi:hypothetical protein